jgi:hypothetical protein
LIQKPVESHFEALDKLPLIVERVSASSHSTDTDKPACHICGTKRQRNLIISYLSKKGESVLWTLCEDKERLYREGKLDRHVICHRCSMLDLSGDDLRYMKDRYFPKGGMRRYKDIEQKRAANAHKRDLCSCDDPGPCDDVEDEE